MATRIPIPQYQQQRTPSLETPAARARPVAVEDPTAQVLGQLGNNIQRVGNVLEQQNAEDARAWVSKASSTDVVKWQTRMTELQEAAQPGAPNFTPTLLQEFDDYSQQALANAPDDTSRRFYGMQLGQLRQTLGTGAVRWEAGQRESHRVGQYTQAAEADAAAITRDPSLYGERRAALMAVLNTSTMNPETKAKLQTSSEQALAYAAGSRMVLDNPAQALAVLSRKPDEPLPDGYEWVPRLDASRLVPLITKAQGYVNAQTATAERARERAEREQERREKVGKEAFDSMSTLLTEGKVPSPEFISEVADKTTGTAFSVPFMALVKEQGNDARFATKPLTQQRAELEQARARAATPGIGTDPVEHASYERKLRMNAAIERDAAQNPWQAAQERGVVVRAPEVPINSVGDAQALINQRMRNIADVEDWVGKPVSPMQPDEAGQIGRMVRTLPPDQQSTALASFGASIGNVDRISAFAKQMSEKDRTLGMAMTYANSNTTQGRLTSELILRGDRALKDGTARVDQAKETGWRAEIAKEIGDATFNQDVRQQWIDSAYYIQAAIAADGGGTDIRRAVNLATGGLREQRDGSKIPRPYGMSDDTFTQRIAAIQPTDIATQAPDGQVFSGKTAMPLDRFLQQLPQASLVHAGQGRYAIRAGQGFVTNSAGQRITLDLNPQRPNATPPNGAQGQPARSR